jgi:hypothetical protein
MVGLIYTVNLKNVEAFLSTSNKRTAKLRDDNDDDHHNRHRVHWVRLRV